MEEEHLREEAWENALAVRLRRRFDGVGDDVVSAALTTYHEIVKWHESSIRLTAEQFAVAKRDPELLRKCVIYLIASDLARGERVPLLCEMWLAPEFGEGRGWVRLKLRLPSKPPPRRD
jgi:hypothetical protein